jgi:hypothetical protein
MNWFIEVLTFCELLWPGTPSVFEKRQCNKNVDACMLEQTIRVPQPDMLKTAPWEIWLQECQREEWDRKF